MTRTLLALLLFSACSKDYDPALPDSSELGSPRGLRVTRVLTHFHSPYSNDACDKNGIVDGVLNATCLANLRNALCTNRVDFLFLSDHPSRMVDYEMNALLLLEGADSVISGPNGPYGNQMSGCSNGTRPVITVGFEGNIIALGMNKHIEATPVDRAATYGGEGSALSSRLKTEADALVVVPHTENKTIAWITDLNPDAIEIYNFHANLDPKIRHKDLGLPPFERIPWILAYLLDPWNTLNADFSFMSFLEVHPVYSQKWNELVTTGHKVTGLLGTDSHENVFKQKASDGERLDGHRRIARMMSNHVLVSTVSIDGVKAAIRAGRVFGVFEGLGSPVGMDFYAVAGATTVGVGGTLNLSGGSATITVQAPTLHASSPQDGDDPIIELQLKRLNTDGSETLLTSTRGTNLSYSASAAGAYRAEVRIQPNHLEGFLGDFSELKDKFYPWIIANPLYLQ